MAQNMHPRKNLILNVLNKNINNILMENHQITKNEISFDNLQTFIGKAVYGEEFVKTQKPAIAQRIKHLQAWQETRRFLVGNICKHIEEIDMLEKKHSQQVPLSPILTKPMFEAFQFEKSPQQQQQQRFQQQQPPQQKQYEISPQISQQTPHHIRILLSLSSSDMVMLGPNGTLIKKDVLQKMNWNLSNANIARKILMEVFDRETLATHTLSGKPSPAFMGCNKPQKMQLNTDKVQDIIYILTNSLDMSEREVRQAITTKCADENKMYRQREEKRLGIVKRRSNAYKEGTKPFGA